MKRFLDLNSSLKISGINVNTHSHLKDMECKKLITAEPNNNISLAKEEADSSSSEALTEMVFLSSSYYNRFGSLIAFLRQNMMKGNKNYPRTVTIAYDMITHFELVSPRRHQIESTVDKGNRENCGGRGGRDHKFVLILGLDCRTSYCIKCFNCEKWGYYDNQCPEPM